MSPPPFTGTPQARPSGTNPTKVILIVLGIMALFCVIACGAFGFMMNSVFSQVAPMVSCSMNVSMTEVSMKAYAKENGGKLPPAATWQDDIQKYYDNAYKKVEAEMKEARNVPMVGGMFNVSNGKDYIPCQPAPNSTGIVYNASVAGMKLADIKNPAETVLLFEAPSPKRNRAEPYDAGKLPKETPKVMGEPRDWLVWKIEGNPDMFSSRSGRTRSSSSSPSFEVTVDDALGKSPAPAAPSEPEAPSQGK